MSAGTARAGTRRASAAVPSTTRSTTRSTGPWWASRMAWMLLVAVGVTMLAIGSTHPRESSSAARVAQLDSIIKCPACEDLSIAQSDAPSSLALRTRVEQFVADGWSSGRIESWVTSRYGSDALLVPPTSGVDETLYVVPLAVLGAAVVGLGWYLWRRRSVARNGPEP
jgi:cytochrome c-type biogenesis protein CcmH